MPNPDKKVLFRASGGIQDAGIRRTLEKRFQVVETHTQEEVDLHDEAMAGHYVYTILAVVNPVTYQDHIVIRDQNWQVLSELGVNYLLEKTLEIINPNLLTEDTETETPTA